MLTKEYRIPLPMTVDEYRIAQLYMIQKKSRLESTGSGSAVEIIENTPYENGPGGSGQYTKKIYHVGSHLPGWLKALLPKTALRIEEEAWNAYPYTKTRHTCPFIEKFSMDIETHYVSDYGQSENVFKLSKSERGNVEVDLIDPIKDTFPQKDYKKEEDPHYFVSTKTERGPLQDNWLEDYKSSNNLEPVMCAYKLIRVEFKYWGMQSKIEQFIQHSLRNPMLVGHRQAWSWQDEWVGLTIEDIRKLERETQLELSKRLVTLNGENSRNDAPNDTVNSLGNYQVAELSEDSMYSSLNSNHQEETSLRRHRQSIEYESNSTLQQECILKMQMKHIEQSESDGDEDDESMFYDALESLDSDEVAQTPIYRHSISSAETISGVLMTPENNDEYLAASPGIMLNHFDLSTFSRKTLIFVVQGGAIMDDHSDADSKLRDFETFKKVFASASNSCYPGSLNAISFELISCPSLSKEIVSRLKELYVHPNTAFPNGYGSGESEQLSNSFPFSSIPLLIMRSLNFQSTLEYVIRSINEKYRNFISRHKDDGTLTDVYILADCVGGLFVYEALLESDNDDAISIASDNDSSISIDSEMFSMDVTSETSFDFIINGFFSFGSPIGLVAFNNKLSTSKVSMQPRCGQIYNLFHPFDPMSARLEPVIDKLFAKIRPAPVPRYQAFPFNDDIQYNYCVLYEDTVDDSLQDAEPITPVRLKTMDVERKTSNSSVSSIGASRPRNKSFRTSWWGTKRVDYMLYCPEGLQQFPVTTLSHLCYNSYWESKDLVTFVLWQILGDHHQMTRSCSERKINNFTNLLPIERWSKKRTALKIKNMHPNHRVNDIIIATGSQILIPGKFAYGPVDLAALSGEKVDIYIAPRPQLNDWTLLGTDTTDSHGRLHYTLSQKSIEPGIYSVQLVVRGDHSSVECNMAIIPPQTEAVVFSIDGSFLASYSLRGIDPKIRGGAVDVVRQWQDLGYLIIYVSSRLLFQKQQVMSWLSQHNFPFGLVSFCENVSADFRRHKIEFLKSITKNERIVIHAAYGSSRDLPVFVSELKLSPEKVFIVGKKTKSKKACFTQWITNGYASHLMRLKESPLSKRSVHNKSMFVALGSFGEPYPQHSKLSKRLSRGQKVNTIHETKESEEEGDKAISRPEKSFGLSFMKSIRSKSKKEEK